MFIFTITWLLLLPMLAEGCLEHDSHLPPCDEGYHIKDCTIPAPPGSNHTKVVQQCYEAETNNIYERWEFWFGLLFSLGLVVGGIIIWRCIRYTQWYKKAKDSLRHEKNRACTRMCVKYCCPCKSCVKCCEPYTRPTAKEIKAEHDKSSNVPTAHHGHHHHHHLHLDRRRSECVHPEQGDHHPNEPTGYHSNPKKQRASFENKTLEELCIEGIHIA